MVVGGGCVTEHYRIKEGGRGEGGKGMKKITYRTREMKYDD